MSRFSGLSINPAFAAIALLGTSLAQTPAKPAADSALPVQKGIALTKAGRCDQALPILTKSAQRAGDRDLKLQGGLAIVRCAMTTDDRASVLNALEWLRRDYPNDPEVLYIATHAFSDLATRTAQDLGRTAPTSKQAHELNAESLEMQGKWDLAKQEYEAVLKQDPSAPGIHFRLGRLLLSKPNPDPQAAEAAKVEFQDELKIDPTNAGAEYVLGELARQSQNWDEAAQHFSRAAKLDASFADAYLGLGQALISAKKFPEAIEPLERAVKLQPANPATHYSLATAYSRTGRKDEAEKEFAIHRRLTQKEPPVQDAKQ